MATLNYLCYNDISDDDCKRCSKRGITMLCPDGCPDFTDVRKRMSPEVLKLRGTLMALMGIEDDSRWEEKQDEV